MSIGGIYAEVMDAAMSSCWEASKHAHEKGERPNTVHMNSETLEHLAHIVDPMGRPVIPSIAGWTFCGLRIEVDESLLLGVTRVSEQTNT